jgi:hypothetical protein
VSTRDLIINGESYRPEVPAERIEQWEAKVVNAALKWLASANPEERVLSEEEIELYNAASQLRSWRKPDST